MPPLFYFRRQLLRWERLGLFPRQPRYGWRELLRADFAHGAKRREPREAMLSGLRQHWCGW
ncbi:MAG: hypothetical protein ACRD1C_07950 [Terriglobales bacterium]